MQAGAAAKTDAMRQQDYDAARQSMLGDFSAEPISACQPCMCNAKAERRKARLALVQSSMRRAQPVADPVAETGEASPQARPARS